MWAHRVPRRADRRVVVTGLGVVSPIGVGVEEFWRASLAGTLGTRPTSRIDTAGLSTDWAGSVEDFEPERYVRRQRADGLSRSIQFAIASARMAWEDAGLVADSSTAERTGLAMGVVLAQRPELESSALRLLRDGDVGDDGMRTSASEVGRAVAAELGLRGPNIVSSNACAAGNAAISRAAELIRVGRADVMIAGGSDQLSSAIARMFDSFHALTPERVQPFDRRRRGLLLGEGAACLVLEALDIARRRDARCYGELRGWGSFADGHHMTAPHPDGTGAERAIRAALANGALTSEDVDYINAHGTGTPSNDLSESRAIHSVFGPAARTIPVSALKSMTGHGQGAASAMEAVSCLLTLRDGVIPPTLNVEEIDPRCDLEIVVGEARELAVSTVINNAFGFGGNVSCVLFAKL